MQRTPAIQVKAIVLAPPMAATIQNVARQLAPSSRKTYTIDVKHFAHWLAGQELPSTHGYLQSLQGWTAIGDRKRSPNIATRVAGHSEMAFQLGPARDDGGPSYVRGRTEARTSSSPSSWNRCS